MSAALGGGLCAFVFISFFVGLIGYANALVAQYFGAGQPGQCGAAVGQALLVSIGVYPLVLATIPLGLALFRGMGVPEVVLIPQSAYFSLIMLGTVFSLLRGAFSAFFSGIGQTRIIMVASAISLVVNVAANYVLIFGKLGFPALGIRGAAFGTIFAALCGVAVLAMRYFSRENRERYGTAKGWRLQRPIMAKLWRFGFPSGVEFFLNLMAFNLIVLAFHSKGLAVAASVTVALNWDMLSFIPMLGLNIGVASLVGRYMGARQPDLAHRATMSGVKLVSFHAILLVFLFSLLAGPMVEVFLPASEGQSYALAVFMVRLVSVYVFADAVGLVFSGALRGAGDTFVTMCISVGAHWILLLVTFSMLKGFYASPKTTWSVLVSMIWMLGGTFYLRYRSGHWRNIKVVDASPEDLSLKMQGELQL